MSVLAMGPGSLPSLATTTALLLAGGLAGCAEAPPSGPEGASMAVAQQALTCVTVHSPGSPVDDTHIATDPTDPTRAVTAYGGSLLLQAGEFGAGQRRALLRFDLGLVPANVTITSAALSLRHASHVGAGALTFHRITAPWSGPTVTWSSFAAAFDPAPLGSLDPATLAPNGLASLDVTALVQAWNNGTLTNHGVLIDQVGGRTLFGASEAGSPASRPALSVCYAPPSCANGVLDGAETGVDCGGPCAPCPDLCAGVTCVALDACHLPGTCSPSTGLCSHPDAPSGAACDDGDACTPVDTCQAGVCVGAGSACGTCSDGVSNQGESGVDCGGPCAPCLLPCGAFDPHASNVVLLAHFDGPDGASTVTDVVGHPLTLEGAPVLDTAQSVSGGSSLYLDGSSDVLFMPNDGSLAFGTGDFTIEYWTRAEAAARILIGYGNYGTEPVFYSFDPSYGSTYWRNPAGNLGAGAGITSSLSFSEWTHVAIQRANGIVSSFVGGVLVGSFADGTSYDTTCGLRIGSFTDGSSCAPGYFFQGHIDELRITKGVARYGDGFTTCVGNLPDPPVGACFDGVQGGGETGVDCGGPCAPCLGVSCETLLLAGLSVGDGVYVLDADGPGPSPAFQAYCDMTNGGFTLVATMAHIAQGFPGCNDATMLNAAATPQIPMPGQYCRKLSDAQVNLVKNASTHLNAYRVSCGGGTRYFRTACTFDTTSAVGSGACNGAASGADATDYFSNDHESYYGLVAGEFGSHPLKMFYWANGHDSCLGPDDATYFSGANQGDVYVR